MRNWLLCAVMFACSALAARAQDCDGWAPIGDPGWRDQATVAYDSGRGVVVMFGGGVEITSYAQLFGETWEHDGRRWTFVTSQTAPVSRVRSLMTYHPRLAKVVLHGGHETNGSSHRNDTWGYSGGVWTLMSANGGLGPYVDTSTSTMGYLADPVIPQNDTIWVTTQRTSGPMSLYRFAGFISPGWTTVTPPVGALWPSGLVGHVGAVDTARNRLVLFAADTGSVWEWDRATWTVTNGVFPVGTVNAAAYAPALGGVVMVQGATARVWNGTSFTTLTGLATPQNFFYAAPKAVTLPDGGAAILGDTSLFSFQRTLATPKLFRFGNGGSQPIGVRPAPGARALSSIAEFPGRGTMLVGGSKEVVSGCGGSPGPTYPGDTWLLRGERWTLLSPSGAGPVANAPLVYDPTLQTMILPPYCGVAAGTPPTASATWDDNAGSWRRWMAPSPPLSGSDRMSGVAVDGATGRAWVTKQSAAGLSVQTGGAWSTGATGGTVQSYGSIAYDPVRNAIVRVGNNNGEATTAYSLESGTWSTIQPYTGGSSATPYPGRWSPGAVYDAGRQAVVFFGGFHSSDSAGSGTFPRSTYLLGSASTAWQRMPTTNVAGRKFMQLSYDPLGERVVMHGGYNYEVLGDTWKLARGPAGVAVPPAPAIAEAGATAVFEVVAKGGGVLRYQWRRDGEPLSDDARIDGARTDLLTITGLTVDDDGIYDVVVTNDCGTATSLGARLTIPGACPADVGSTGGTVGPDGELSNNDFVVFIDWFFAADPRADIGAAGGVPGADASWDNNDFVVFIDLFFTGC